jgi:hypothetical protein
MESRSLKLPEIPSSEQTPLVQRLLQIILEQQKRIEGLEEEVLRLKRETVKPKTSRAGWSKGELPRRKQGSQGVRSLARRGARPKSLRFITRR